MARPSSVIYQLKKFTRRNKVVVGSASLLVLILIAATGVSLAFAVYAGEKEEEATAKSEELRLKNVELEDAWKQEQNQREMVEQVAEFQAEQLSGIEVPHMGVRMRLDLLERAGRAFRDRGLEKEEIEANLADLEGLIEGVNFTDAALTVLDENIFDSTLAAIESQFESQPLVQARLLQTVATTLRALGLYERAEAPQRTAPDIRHCELGNDHRDTLGSMNDLAGLYWILRRPQEAEPLLEQILEIRRRVLGEEHLETLASWNALATLRKSQGRYDDAEQLYKRTLDIQKRVLGEEHRQTLICMTNLAGLYADLSRNDEAVSLYRHTLEIQRKVLGEQNPITLQTMKGLANAYSDLGRYDEAEPLYVETIDILTDVLGEEHSQTLTSMNNLAILRQYQGRYDDAETLYKHTLDIQKRVLGQQHPDTLGSTNNLASMYTAQGRYDEAEPLHVETLEIRKRILGDEDPDTLFSMMNLANLYVEQERFAEAETLQTQTVAASRRVWPAGAWFIGAFLGNYGETLLKLQRYHDAEEALVEAYEILTRSVGPENEYTIGVVESFADLYTAWHEAEPDKGYDAKADEWRAKLPNHANDAEADP